MIVLAREARGVTQRKLAASLAISQSYLSKLEAGMAAWPDKLMHRLESELRYPARFFHQTDPVLGPGSSEFFHRARRAVSSTSFARIHADLNIRHFQIARLLQAAELPVTRIPRLDPSEYGSVVEVARALRASWNVPAGPFDDLTRSIEDAGGIVVHIDFGTPLVDAISRWVPGLPNTFFVNAALPGDRQRLSLAHELAHIILHATPRPDMEEEANAFAAELLMPKADILPELIDISLHRLAALKPRWRVSIAALLYRSVELRRVSPRKARSLWTQLGKAGLRLAEPPELSIPREQSSLVQELIRIHMRELGYTTAELAEFLGLFEDEFIRLYGPELTPTEHRRKFRVLSSASA